MVLGPEHHQSYDVGHVDPVIWVLGLSGAVVFALFRV